MIIGKSLTALGGGGLKPEIRVTAKAGALLNLHYKDSSIILQSYQLGAEETQHTFMVDVNATAYVIDDATNVKSVEVLVDAVAVFNVNIYYGRLEPGYTEVEYIQSIGNQVIHTGIAYNSSIGVSIDAQHLELPNTGKVCATIGWIRTTSQPYYGWGLHLSNSSGTSTIRYKCHYGSNSAVAELSSSNFLDRFTASHNLYNNGKVIYNGTTKVSSGVRSDKTAYICIFGYGTSDSGDYWWSSKMKLYSCKITSGSDLIRDYVPCVRDEDGAAGVFDLVTKSFLGSSNSNNFIIGNLVE